MPRREMTFRSKPGHLPGARNGLGWRGLALAALAVSGFLVGAVLTGDAFFVLAGALSPLYLVQALFTLGAALERPAAQAAAVADDPDWPNYTLLVPLYRESEVAPALIQSLREIDYPADRLQVVFLLEVDDPGTAAALTAAGLPSGFELAWVPPGGPRTKPNALNHGLGLAHGDFVTVYDAEDIPEPSQLKDAVRLFRQSSPDTACLQARLAIDNASDGWLALMMTIEYAALFDATKCGFAAMSLPVALGGTSNHFRSEAISDVGGWDAWNVAEDADMGLRLARAGRHVADLASVTREEAPFGLAGWFAQRRRWHKGFLQTMVTHGRATGAALTAVGLSGWLAGVAQIAGSLLGALFYPFFAAHVLWLGWTGALFDNDDAYAMVRNTLALWVAACGLMVMVAPAVIGLRRRRAWHLAPWLLTMPVYQLLISAAAWVALIDYIRAPSHWLKTEHGKGNRAGSALRSKPEWRS
jgi:glycosyltransferase XagB